MTNFRKLSKVDGISKKNKSSGKKGHVGHIFALAISSDSKYLVILENLLQPTFTNSLT